MENLLPHAGSDLMIALDIDGTILGHDGSLSKRVKEAIHAHIDAGTRLMLATGRGIHGTQLALSQLEMTEGVAVCSNGAISLGLGETFLPTSVLGGREIIESRSKLRRLDVGSNFRVLSYSTFDPREQILLLHEALPEALLAVEELDGPRRINRAFPPGELSGPNLVLPVDQLGVENATRLTVRATDLTSEELYAAVRSIGMEGVEYAVGWSAWLDVSPFGISKGAALEDMRTALGVAPQATVAVGDGGNDLEMLRWAEYGVAMGGASPRVVAAANAQTKPVDEDGLAEVLESLY
ncbi:HAD family hydrolase [Ancrocorticia populi]|uniref:HAD family hydrolase n=1 Tax=Ancrocorticia populi TaxID=2175228 RepID=UPI003F90BB54